MRAASRCDHRMNFIDDHRANGAKHCATSFGGQQQVKRFGCGDENMRGCTKHRRALALGRVASANGSGDPRRVESHLLGNLANPLAGLREILVDVRA